MSNQPPGWIKGLPWHDDNGGKTTYKGASIIDPDTAETIDDFGLGHWLDNARIFSRPEYAYRAARKIIPENYFFLVKIVDETTGIIAWTVILTGQDTSVIFTSISEPTT